MKEGDLFSFFVRYDAHMLIRMFCMYGILYDTHILNVVEHRIYNYKMCE